MPMKKLIIVFLLCLKTCTNSISHPFMGAHICVSIPPVGIVYFKCMSFMVYELYLCKVGKKLYVRWWKSTMKKSKIGMKGTVGRMLKF